MAVSQTSFDERLARIAAQKRQAKGQITLHVGEQEVQVRDLDDLRRVLEEPVRRPRRLLTLLGMIAALAIAGLAVTQYLAPEALHAAVHRGLALLPLD